MRFIMLLLGMLDIAAAIVLATASWEWIPTRIMLMFAAYLVIKGIAFFSAYVSRFDMVIGFYLMLAAVGVSIGALNIILGLYLGLKGIYSLV